ncbi:rhodanese-like domain-containing protein [Polaribacter tangerinus]|uniref:rhodanese-like domain-containing protein n=1 Tax=Polaribacter tangerinus TaxID=1920034 RepID=UPI000B4BD7FE|nr:rhodanese-like domain-containing protein [Polaribacter tangerinus]
MKRLTILFLLITSTSLSAQSELDKLLNKWNKNKVPYIDVKNLAKSAANIVILDAREEKEYRVSHIKNAIHVGFENFNLKNTVSKLPPNYKTKIVVYCSLGIRSEKIAYELIQAGFTNVYNLYGGIFEWKNNNLKVIDSTGNSTEKIHAFDKNWGEWLLKGEKIYHK